MDDKQYLLSKNNIVQDGHKVKNKELYALLKQKPNKKILGFIPMYLNIYNFAAEKGSVLGLKVGQIFETNDFSSD